MTPFFLTINPGSTSTKLALFHGRRTIFSEEIPHTREQLALFPSVLEQKDYRKSAIRSCLARHRIGPEKVSAVIGRGGLLRPLPGGVYAVDEAMLHDLSTARYGEHASNLGAIIAWELAGEYKCSAYIVDPVVTDEMRNLARYTGLPSVRRRSVFHALSQRAAAHHAAHEQGLAYEEGRFIVAHMGGGISIGAHEHGRVVDVINALDGEGPFSPERAGRLPLITVLDMLQRGEETPESLRGKVLTRGGLFAHAGTNDLRVIEKRAQDGEDAAAELIRAMAYQIAKEIASMAPPLMNEPGARINAIVLTGGLSRSRTLTRLIRDRVGFLGPVAVVPDVDETRAMADGLTRALHRHEEIHRYASAEEPMG